MLMNKFPLHIQIMNEHHLEDGDVAMDDITPVSTPTEQTGSYDWPQPPRYGRTASVSSIASSVSNLSQAGGNDFSYSQFASHYKLSEPFESMLCETYQTYQTNPQITPFNASNPPSGILNKVSKDALKRAVDSGIDIGIEVNNYSLVIIRQKLIQLCRSSSVSSASTTAQPPLNYAQHQVTATRTNSVSSLNGFPTVNLSSKFSSTPPIQTASAFQQPMWDLRTPTESPSASYFSFEVPNTPPASSESQLQPSFMHEQLEAQQHLEHQIKQDIVLPELYNATSSRKRESLRLKRNGSKVTYN
ncbi:hypothetical protein BON22_0381 [Cyberlindnera fabianii]|nr:hypothetical protein BON22_0381 [Cyberlindnera fabianii]